MPWTPDDAPRHTHKANTPARRKLWAKVANRTRELAADHGYADPDAHAIKVANAAVARVAKEAQ